MSHTSGGLVASSRPTPRPRGRAGVHLLCIGIACAAFAACGDEDRGADQNPVSGGGSGGNGGAGVAGGTAGPIGGSGTGGGAGSARAGAGGSSAAGSSATGGAGGGNSGQGGGASGRGGAGGMAGPAGSGGAEPDAGTSGTGGEPATDLEPFSFFTTSLAAMQRLSASDDGFGGDLTYGEADGLTGADKICTEIAEASMEGAAAKGWRAFLSVSEGPGGGPVNAIDRIGEGPWYDRVGRIVAMDKAALANTRPQGADPIIYNDLPNEDGVPNHRPDPNQPEVDNHHILTGSDTSGRLYMGDDRGTCGDWTSIAQSSGRPRIGFSWIAGGRTHWISGQDEGGCGAGVNLIDGGGSDPSNPIVGSGGGYGGIYCFALMP